MRHVLFCADAFWTEERRLDVCEGCPHCFRATDPQKCGGLHGRHCGQEQRQGNLGSRLGRDLCELAQDQPQAQPREVRVRSSLRKLLGFFASQRGIEANPDKIKAIEQIEAPARVKDVRRLAGCVAALSRLISKSAERALPFFKVLKKAGPVKWTPEAEAELQDLKKYLSSAPILVAPKQQEKLLLYLATTNQVVSVVLVAEREADDELATAASTSSDKQGAPPISSGPDKDGSAQAQEEVQKKKMVQRPVYFVSSLLQGARSRYSGVQK